MGILRDFEKRLEGAVEGFFARAFRSGLQPVELAKAVQRYAGDYQQVGLEGVFVPNVYRFALSPEDLERFRGFESSLKRELADVVRRTAADRGWRLKGPVRFELTETDDVRVGTYELRGKVEAGPDEPRPVADEQQPPVRITDERAGGGTGVLPSPDQSAYLQVLAGGPSGRRYKLGSSAVVGRLPECDVTIDDPSVSRRHARITRQGEGWSVEDLGSTNGLRINGAAVGSARLRHGDRLELGTVKLAFSLER